MVNYGIKLNEKYDRKPTKGGVSIVWKSLRVTAEIKKHHIFQKTTRTRKRIIHDVNGYVESSSLVGILGASGSGKSTIMSALANRLSGDLKVDGDIRINGKKLQMKMMKVISGFVYQDELFIPTLTVFEHLHFAARLKLDRNLTAEHRKKLIEELIRDVGLTNCAKNIIGGTGYGNEKMMLSGGERKRLSVATELLTDPPLLFCDEPTTGLDSFTSLKLITMMKNMVIRRGTTIICTIHQPSEQIFNLFHQIILLYEGKIAFSGTVTDAMTFFQSLGCNYSEEQNPASYLIECLAVVPQRESETSAKALNICHKFEKSHHSKIINDRIEAEEYKTDQDFGIIEKKKRIPWFHKLYVLTHREFLVSARNFTSKRIELTNKLLSTILVGICMMGTTTMTQEGIRALQGVLFYMLHENWLGTVYSVLGSIPNQMPMFFREYNNNANTPALFYLSNFISMIPLLLITPILTVTLMYTLVGLRNSWTAYWWSLVFNVLVNFTSSALGLLVSLSTNSINTASIIFYIIGITFLLNFGIMINLRSIPWIVSWIRYISWLTYAMEVLFDLQLNGINHIECTKEINAPCLKTGREVIEWLGFHENNLTKNFTIICIIYFVLFILGYLALEIKLYSRTKR